MPTWDELRESLRGCYAILRDESNWIGMAWTFRAGEVEVEQRLKIERVFAFESEWILVYSAVCAADKIDAVSALRWNSLVAVGTLAIDGNYCVLRHTLPLANLACETLDLVIENVAREAARLGRPAGHNELPSEIYRPFEE